MKKTTKVILSLAVCLTLVLSSVGITAYAMNNKENNNNENTVTTTTSFNKDNLITPIDESNSETVYVIANAKGEASQVIVDEPDSDALNYHDNAENLPINVKVTYTLDGAEIEPSELVGKNGHIVIRFDYENLLKEKAVIEGFEEDLYVPFAAITGVILNDDKFTNVEVKNGRLMDDGDRTTVVGIAFPGLQEDLQISSDKFEVPSYVEIEAEVTDFELEATYTIVSNSIFSAFNLDAEGIGSFDDIQDSATKLSDAMTALITGSDELHNGLGQLLSGANQLVAGIDTLNTGLNTLSKSSATLNGGAKQVFDSLLAQATASLKAGGAEVPALTIDNYYTVLKAVLAKMGVDIDNPGPAAANEKVKAILTLKAQLDAYNQFYQGVKAYTAGVDQAAAGCGKLNASAPQLVGGIKKLEAGSKELHDGLVQFNNEGIKKIIDVLNGDLAEVSHRIAPILDVANKYTTYEGTSDTVKFIYKTDAINK